MTVVEIPLKYVSEVVAGQSPLSTDVSDLEQGQPFLQGNAEFGTVSPLARYECDSAPKVASKDDLLISVRAPVGALNIADKRYGIGRGLCAIRPHHAYPQFLWWWLHHARQELNAVATGSTFEAVSAGQIGALRVPKVSLEAQRKIAAFLDRETSQIDAVIAKQEELIGLLGERRSAVIAHTVTNGLDPSAPMKATRIDGVPQVPKHWVTGNIRRFAEMHTGHTPSRSVPEYWEHCDIPWFTLADVWQLREGRTHVTQTKERISKLGLDNSAAELLPVGTVLLSRTASVGFVGIASVEMATSQDFWNWVCGPRLRPEYLLYYLRAIAPGLRGISRGSTHRTIYKPVAAGIQLPVPPLDEQQAISDFIGEQCGALDSLILKAEESISLMRERRAALISDAVTGRLDIETYGRGRRPEEGVA